MRTNRYVTAAQRIAAPLRVVLLLLAVSSPGCVDLPTSSRPTSSDTSPLHAEQCVLSPDGKYFICSAIDSQTPPPYEGECGTGSWSAGCGQCMYQASSDSDMQAISGCPDGGSTDGSGGTGPGDGGGGTPPPGGEEQVPRCSDEDPTFTCEEPADDEIASCIDLGCQLRDPTPEEKQRVLDLIDSLRTDGFCGEVRTRALEMVNRRLQIWDNRVTIGGRPLYGEAPWDFSRGGHVMYLWKDAMTAWTIAHEAIHGIWNPTGLGRYYAHSDITPIGRELDSTAGYCAGNP
jgi:hypothetical protein